MRPETGPLKFGDDWRGVFIRGDDALAFAQMLRRYCEMTGWTIATIASLAKLLESANEHEPATAVQFLKPFDDCL